MTGQVPDSLLTPGLRPVWASVRRQLDRFGLSHRGTVARPALDAYSSHVLESLLGRKPTSRVDLTSLERALVARDIAADLDGALTRLGFPPSEEARERRAKRERLNAARRALAEEVRSWREPWAREWARDVRKSGLLSGLDARKTTSLIANVRRLLDRLDRSSSSCESRTELAAGLFGSSHALDLGTPLATLVTHALRYRVGDRKSSERALWEKAGILADRVSAPALAWSVPAKGDSPLARQMRGATESKLPLHASLFALRMHPVALQPRTFVLVVENPRLVEAAAERALPGCVVAGNGNPSAAVMELLAQMRQSGVSILYHGDFDAPGIAICRRMFDFGLTPWMMDACDYERGILLAKRKRVRLQRGSGDCGPTPWDNSLQTVFEKRRMVIHEEFVVDDVLGTYCEIAARRREGSGQGID